MKTLVTAIAVVGSVTMFAGAALAASPAQCNFQARQYADAYANPAGNVVGGAATGAILGGVASAILGGNVGTGLAVGAIGGGTIGAVRGSARWRQLYNSAYYQCINSAPQPAPVASCPALHTPSGYDDGYLVGSPQWAAACNQKYRSFNPATWLFNGYDGCQHYCNL
jgi:hypothetical protein